MEKKLLNFDMDDPKQNEAYKFLDRVRYYQTRFITKLVTDFFRIHNVSLDTPYFDTKKLVRAYIDGYVEFAPSVSSTPTHNNDTLNAILANITQQQAFMQQQMVGMMGQIPQIPLPTQPSVSPVYVPATAPAYYEAKPQGNPVSDDDSFNPFSEDEDMDEDMDLDAIRSGFANMAGS